jgi:hypothetical protein
MCRLEDRGDDQVGDEAGKLLRGLGHQTGCGDPQHRQPARQPQVAVVVERAE